MKESAADFRTRLLRFGLAPAAVNAAWPAWWSEAADASASAQAELRFSLARKLGLDPRSLLAEGQPQFVWDDSVKYKNFKGDASAERPAISSYGISVTRMLLAATDQEVPIVGLSAKELRTSILATNQDVGLRELLAFAWAVGIPVIHLRLYPLSAKRMAAMSARMGGRHGVLLAHDSVYPPALTFHLAHEIGHIALNHVRDGSALVDVDDIGGATDDPEEKAADAFALELLTGSPAPRLEVAGNGKNAKELASESLRLGARLRIEPGTLALCFGYTTGQWALSNKSLKHIYNAPMPAWAVVNGIAEAQLDWAALDEDAGSFLRAVMGGTADG